MSGANLDELRDLARRSRRAQRWGFLALLVALLLFPAQIALADVFPPIYVSFAALTLGAMPFVMYAFVAGEERGAFRRVFRRIAEEKRATRTLVPEVPVAVTLIEK